MPGVLERSSSSKQRHGWDHTNIDGKPSAPGEGDVQSRPGMQKTHGILLPSQAGKGQERLVATLAGAGKWEVISVQRCRASFVLALGTIYGFRGKHNRKERRARQLHVS